MDQQREQDGQDQQPQQGHRDQQAEHGQPGQQGQQGHPGRWSEPDLHSQQDPAGPAVQPSGYPAAQQPVVDPAFAAAYPQHPGYGPAPAFVVPAPTPRSTRRRRTAVALLASGALAAGLVLGGSAVALGWPDGSGTGLTSSPESGSGTSEGSTSGLVPGGTLPGGTGLGSGLPGGTTTLPGTGTGTESGTSTLDTTTATDDQAAGVVLVSTVLGYQSAEAAGSGVVLTSDGIVLTNNHVVEGATEITVTTPSGESYTAEVVGTDASADVAVLQLQDASGLTTATLDDDGDPAVGDTVTAVGNAEGGGVLMAASGTVTALDESITTQAEGVSQGESLSGLIQVDADVVSGDSGGALLDDEGEVVGITTAASSGSADITGYAIPVGVALDVATQILSGQDTDSIVLGYPAFLGVQLATTQGRGAVGTTAGATVAGVIEGTPAAGAGLVAGDTITAVDGVAVADGDALSAALAEHAPGDQVTLTWTTTSGTTTLAAVTLVEGPAA